MLELTKLGLIDIWQGLRFGIVSPAPSILLISLNCSEVELRGSFASDPTPTTAATPLRSV